MSSHQQAMKMRSLTTPEMIKDDSQIKRTSFTERFAAMVGMKPREKEVIAVTEKSKTFGTVSTMTTEANQDKEQVTQETVCNQEKRTKSQEQCLLSWET